MKSKLADTFGRNHDYLRISLTDKCNFRCFYCMPEEGVPFTPHQQLMQTDEVVQLARLFVSMGVNKIRLTGGEPLVRKDFSTILQQLAQLPVELAITTNGTLVDQYINDFKRNGLRSVNVSLDTLNPQKFHFITKRDNYHKVRSNIYLLMQNDFHVKVNVVITKGMNEEELLDFIEWTRHEPVHIRFIEFMPFNGNQWKWKKVVSHQKMLETISEYYIIRKLPDAPHSTSKSYQVQGYMGTFAVISSVTAPFCDSCNRLRLMADGKLKNCLFAQNEFDLLTPYRGGKDVTSLIEDAVRDKAKEWGDINKSSSEVKQSMVQMGG